MATSPMSGIAFELKPASAKCHGAVSEAAHGAATWEKVGLQGSYETLKNVDRLEACKLGYNIIAM